MKTKKFILYVGLNDKDTKHQEVSTLDAYKVATNIFIKINGGATISEAQGIYTHEDGTIVTETTLRCEIFNSDTASIEKAAQFLKDAFNQESIAIEEIETNSKFF